MKHRMRMVATLALAAATAGSLVTATSHDSAGGTPAGVRNATAAARPAAARATALAPITITLSGLDGTHGPVTESIQSSATTAAATTAAGAKTAVTRGATTAGGTSEGAASTATKPATTKDGTSTGTAAANAAPEGISVVPAEGSTARSAAVRPHGGAPTTTTLANGLDLTANGASTFTVGTPGSGGMRYVYANFKVRNAQFCNTPGTCTAYTTATHNLTLMAAETSGTIAQTAISKMSLFDGTTPSNAATLATQVIPTDGVAGDGNLSTPAVYPEPGLESLQVFTEGQVAAMTSLKGVTLLPYGYVVKNLNSNTTRALPASPAANQYDGGVTIAVAFPTQSPATANPFSLTLTYLPIDDTNTRVTQSLEDDNQFGDSTVAARATALGSHDIAVLGNNHVTATNNGDPICSVRTAGTAASPTAFLVKDAYGPNLASLPYNQNNLSPTGTIIGTFCQNVAAPGNFYSAYVISGSESGLRTSGGKYDGSYSGGGPNFTFTPTQAFFTGERVNLTVTNGVTGINGTAQGFAGISTVGGTAPSVGQFASYDDTSGQLFSGSGAETPTDATVADFDGDGNADLAIAHSVGVVTVQYGDGHGGFGVPDNGPNAPNATAIAAPDLNGDGHPDLVVADGTSNEITVALWTGGHRFGTPTTISTGSGSDPSGITFADFNGDGHEDVAVADKGTNTVTVLFGDGTGAFPTSATVTPPSSSYTGPVAVAVGDFNNDGHLDLAVANATSSNVYVALGNGASSFATSAADTFATGTDPVEVRAADFNGDGFLDVATVNQTGNSVSISYGTGAGTFSAITTVSLASTAAPDAIVPDRLVAGGRTDLLVAESGLNKVVRLYNGGGHTFTATTAYSTGPAPVAVAAADVDNDGRADLVAVNATDDSFNVFLSQGDGVLVPAKVRAPVEPSIGTGSNPEAFRPAVGDFNGDGKLDIAFPGPDEVTIDLGDGHGGVLSSRTISLDSTANPAVEGQDVQVADFNGDGIPDLAVTGGDEKDVVILQGDGTGNFTVVNSQTLPGEVDQGVVGDFNGDGRMDYATMTLGSPSNPGDLSVWLNTGNFTFSITNTVENFDQDNSLDVTDVNGDGNLDLVVTSTYLSAFAEELLGDGTGHFATPVTLVQGGSDSFFSQVTTGDFNADGIPDIAFADLNSSTLYVLTGKRGGGFNQATYPVGQGPFEVLAGDVNGDGFSDVVVVNSSSDTITVLLGSASGMHALPEAVNLPYAPQYFSLGDFNGSHKLSAVVEADGVAVILPQL